MTNTLTIRLSEELDSWLDEVSRQTGVSKSRIVREQLEISRTRARRQPFLDLAGKIEGEVNLSQRKGFQK
jgi:predicted transcriptional regulator